jgi:hypothetical protein
VLWGKGKINQKKKRTGQTINQSNKDVLSLFFVLASFPCLFWNPPSTRDAATKHTTESTRTL